MDLFKGKAPKAQEFNSKEEGGKEGVVRFVCICSVGGRSSSANLNLLRLHSFRYRPPPSRQAGPADKWSQSLRICTKTLFITS